MASFRTLYVGHVTARVRKLKKTAKRRKLNLARATYTK